MIAQHHIDQVISAAKAAIEATGTEVKTSTRSSKEMLLGVRKSHFHRVFGPAAPLTCWTQAYEYATGKNWTTLITDWRPKPQPRSLQNNRGEMMMLAGSPFEVEDQLKELERKRTVLSAVYTRRGQRQIIVHAEVI